MNTIQFILQVCRPFKWYISGCFLSIIIYAITGSLRPYLSKTLVDFALAGAEGVFWYAALGLMTLYFIVPLNWRFYDWCHLNYEPALKNNIATTCIKYLTKHDYKFFQNNFAGGLNSKINDVASLAPTIIVTIIHSYVGNSLLILFAILTISTVNIYIALCLFLWALLIIFVSSKYHASLGKLARDTAEKASLINSHMVDNITNILNVKLFATRDAEMQHLSHYQKEYLATAKNRRIKIWRFNFIQGMTFAVYQLSAFALLIYLFNQKKVTAGDFVLIMMINAWVIDSIWHVSEQMRNFGENWGAITQALSLIFSPLSVQDIKDAMPLKVTQGKIEFDKVVFNYNTDRPLFCNKSIVINSGEKVGLVGYSGSGKSTFVNIILRLYDINSGSVRIDDQDISKVTQDSLRSSIAMIPQDPSLFHRSIMENIRYGRLGATDDEVIKASIAANADDFITKLPNGYNALVGERGIKLSGGQRQRIAIARAILKDAPILILDEATSQLDSVTEEKIQKSLNNLMRNKTNIIIAHRLSTLLSTDRILVFDKGVIVEDGTHKSLLKKGELYKTLWDAQVGGFLPENQ